MGKKRGRVPGEGSSPRPVRQRPVQVTGPARDIVFAIRADGSSPARDFLEGLSLFDQDKFNVLFIRMAEHGEIRNAEKFRPKVGEAACRLGDRLEKYPIAEFKIHTGSGQRILAFLDGRQWVLTNGFAKGEKLSIQTKKANAIICDDMAGRGRSLDT
jgi:hypothetical protein